MTDCWNERSRTQTQHSSAFTDFFWVSMEYSWAHLTMCRHGYPWSTLMLPVSIKWCLLVPDVTFSPLRCSLFTTSRPEWSFCIYHTSCSFRPKWDPSADSSVFICFGCHLSVLQAGRPIVPCEATVTRWPASCIRTRSPPATTSARWCLGGWTSPSSSGTFSLGRWSTFSVSMEEKSPSSSSHLKTAAWDLW